MGGDSTEAAGVVGGVAHGRLGKARKEGVEGRLGGLRFWVLNCWLGRAGYLRLVQGAKLRRWWKSRAYVTP